MSEHRLGTAIGCASLLVAVVAAIFAVTTPEVRARLGLESPSKSALEHADGRTPATPAEAAPSQGARVASSEEIVATLSVGLHLEQFKLRLGPPLFVNAAGPSESGDDAAVAELTEYIFGVDGGYVQVIAGKTGNAEAYGITSTSPDFEPVFEAPGAIGGRVQLGVTRFASFKTKAEPEIVGIDGANWFYYAERYHLGRQSNYLTFVLANNENGGDPEWPRGVEFDRAGYASDSELLDRYRSNSIVNTVIFTTLQHEILQRFGYGPSSVQLRAVQ